MHMSSNLMGSLIAGAVTISLLFVVSKLWSFTNNYRAARATKLPIVICPYDPDSVFWSIFSVPLRPILHLVLPTPIFATVELSIWGWEFRDKAAIHEKLGPVFVVVTTGLNRLVCADPTMAHTIMSRRRDFVHPDITTATMGFLGPNIVTAKDESWSRQRRIVSPSLNERISPEVWKVSVEQASCLVDILLSAPPTHTIKRPAKIVLGLRTIAMNVLARIAYGHNKPFALSPPSTRPSADISYVDAISLVTDKLIYAAFLPASFLDLPFMPRISQQLGIALKRLPGLTQDMLNQERQKSASTSPNVSQTTESPNDSPETIMKTLVHLSDQEKNWTGTSTRKSSDNVTKKFLTEEEIAGNLFIFTAAGFDTTANTMSYAVTLLAVYPEWQAWIQTEIDTVFGGPDMSPTDYATAFPKLVRCLAVMLETLRLFPPVTLLMRSITTSQNIAFADTSFQIAAPSTIYVNTMSLHTSRSTWGSDSLSFNPARWLQPNTPEPALITPPQGTFMPWSVGPRVCPGQKMSQVEFVAVIATLFHRCNARPIAREGESMQLARQRLLDLLQDSQPVLTLQINKPEDVHIHWDKR